MTTLRGLANINTMNLISIESLPLCPFNFIPLTKEKVAKVDREDYLKLSRYNWFITGSGYACRQTGHGRGNQKMLPLHREIMGMNGGIEVDHINGDKLDNRRENLRNCSTQQNQWNSRIAKSNTSGSKGVYFNKALQKFHAQIRTAGKRTHLGFFNTAESAYEAYKIAAVAQHGEFANFG